MTGEGIANTYFVAEELNLGEEWLEKYVHHHVPNKYRFMTRGNLVDTLNGLKKYHKDSPYVGLVQEELEKRPAEAPEHVQHLFNETVKF